MKKRIAMMLCFVLMLSFVLCACGGEKKENLAGTWTGTIDMAEMFNAEIASDPEMAKYVKMDEMKMVVVLELKEDGTCTLGLDPDSVTAAVDQMIACMSEGIEAYFVDVFAAQGLQIDVNEALSAMGISLDDLVAELKDELMADDAFGELTTEAKHKAEDGKMYFSEDLDSEINTGEYALYTLEGDTLTMEKGTMPDENEMFGYLFPLVLTRTN